MARSPAFPRLVPAVLLLVAAVAGQATSTRSRDSAAKSGLPTIDELIAQLKSREKAAKSVVLTMETTGWFPGGRVLKTTGSLRVLGKTHVHVKMGLDFGDGFQGEHELVKTPEGAWTRETDPAQGTVYTSFKPELLKRLDEAEAQSGEGLPGISNDIDEAHGSAMLESLQKTFDLKVVERIPDRDLLIIKGPVRAESRKVEDRDLPDPDMVEVNVRERDMTIVEMRQFKGGNRILEVKITSLDLDRELDKTSFRIALPEGAKFVDAMEHPPMREQIDKILKDAGLKEPSKEAGKEPSKEAGTKK